MHQSTRTLVLQIRSRGLSTRTAIAVARLTELAQLYEGLARRSRRDLRPEHAAEATRIREVIRNILAEPSSPCIRTELPIVCSRPLLENR